VRTRLVLCLIAVTLLCRSRDLAANPEPEAPAQGEPFADAVGFWGVDDSNEEVQFFHDFYFDGQTVVVRLLYKGAQLPNDLLCRLETKWVGDQLHWLGAMDRWHYLATFHDGRFVVEEKERTVVFSRMGPAARRFGPDYLKPRDVFDWDRHGPSRHKVWALEKMIRKLSRELEPECK
jgi:hypothetical protein